MIRQNRILNNYQGPNLQNINPSTVGSVKASTNVVQDGAVKQSSVSAMDPMRDSLNGPSMISQVSSNTIAPIPSVPGNNLVTQLNPADLLPSNTASPGLVGMNNLLNSRDIQIGMQSQALKNANLSIRADPVIPTSSTPLPAAMSTITSDNNSGGLKVDC